MQDEYIQKRINSYNEYLLSKMPNDNNLGLFHGKMGLSIYLYMQYRINHDKRFETMADKNIQEIYTEIDNCKDTSIENGITGIGVGFLYLMNTGLCEGNPNVVLKEIDDAIFKALCTSINNQSGAIHEDIYKCLYLCIRMKNPKLAKNELLLFSRIVIKAFNKISRNISNIINSEPPFFQPFSYPLLMLLLLIEMMSELGLYNTKISLVLKEWKERLQVVYPISIGHRYLLSGIVSRMTEKKIFNTNFFFNVLKTNIKIEEFFYSEMKNMSLSLASGASGLWFFMKIAGMSNEHIDRLLTIKMNSSDIWTKKNKDECSLINDNLISGMPGIILTYQKLCNHA